MKKIIQILIIVMLLICPALAEEGTVSSYSESVVEGSGTIQATAEAVVNAFGAFASSTITVTANGGSAVAIAFAQVYNYGHSTTGVTVGGAEGGTDATIDTSVVVQTVNENAAQVDAGVTGNEITVMAIASANDPLPPIIQPVQVQVQKRAFYGYTFGKCDVQRYKHFWLQLKDNNTENDARAKYNMELIAERLSNGWGDQAITEMEGRYNISDRYPSDQLNGNGVKNGNWCTMPSNGNGHE